MFGNNTSVQMLQLDRYEQPNIVDSQPHSQTFHQVRQGVMPLHLGKQGTKGGTRWYQNETGWLMQFQVFFKSSTDWCFLLYEPHIHEICRCRILKLLAILDMPAVKVSPPMWLRKKLRHFERFILKQQNKFEFMDFWVLLREHHHFFKKNHPFAWRVVTEVKET